MSKYCMNCGAQMEDDAVFCPECGTRAEAAAEEPRVTQEAAGPAAAAFAGTSEEASGAGPAPQPEPRPQSAGGVDPSQVYQTGGPVPVSESYTNTPAPEPRSKEIPTAGYFWLMFLYAIPGIGFIAMLIFSFAAKNKNIRNFSRAHLVWIAVALVVTTLLYIILRIALRAAGVVINWEDLFNTIKGYFTT